MRTIRAFLAKSPAASLRSLRPRPALAAAAALLVLVAAAVAAGCGGSDESGGFAPSLEGTAWKLIDWSISSQDPSDFTITAQFSEGRIGGTSAVNQYAGPYTTDDGSFSVGELVSTMMAGPEADMKAEQSYLTLLAAAKKYQVDGETLTLMDASGNESLIYAATSVATPGS